MTPGERESGLDGLIHLPAGLVDQWRSAHTAEDGPLSLEAIRGLADAPIARQVSDFDVDTRVRGLGNSRTRLCAAFSERGGVRATIRNARLDSVRTRLAVLGGTIEAIAVTAGFRDDASISRAFQRRFGGSLREAREGHL
ncbi:helix-turn-helix domain-containing protein [Methylobacterium sp. Leaf118]|uniref:helix-turn-helix domain-containing protein n=1 Tax=Methylobacterium sp. Leaf118 TaxID=2876562 RepID=UPI001E6100CA|nr:helix-turn-helix domain-containing protein [Methylobacterium sp. Leaf118]